MRLLMTARDHRSVGAENEDNIVVIDNDQTTRVVFVHLPIKDSVTVTWTPSLAGICCLSLPIRLFVFSDLRLHTCTYHHDIRNTGGHLAESLASSSDPLPRQAVRMPRFRPGTMLSGPDIIGGRCRAQVFFAAPFSGIRHPCYCLCRPLTPTVRELQPLVFM